MTSKFGVMIELIAALELDAEVGIAPAIDTIGDRPEDSDSAPRESPGTIV
jgi:hypothetical protein